MNAVEDKAEEALLKSPAQGYSWKYKDDMNGQMLRGDLVLEAREKEMAYFVSRGVCMKRPMRESRARKGKPPISVRWVDVNKGDDANPKYSLD